MFHYLKIQHNLNPLYSDSELRSHLIEGCENIMSNTNQDTKALWHSEYDYIAVIDQLKMANATRISIAETEK